MPADRSRSPQSATRPAQPVGKSAARPVAGLDSRRAALHLLQEVLGNRTPLDQAAAQLPFQLSGKDRALALAIVTAVCREKGRMDALLTQFMKNPFKDQSIVQFIAYIGLSQLLLMDGIKPHAAIYTAVELARQKKIAPALLRTLNAILRRAQREGAERLAALPVDLNIPPWLQETLHHDYGEQTEAVFTAFFAPSPFSVRVRDPHIYETFYETFPAEIDGLEGFFTIDLLPDSLEELPGWVEGKVYLQNPAAGLPAHFLAQSALPEGAVLDLCAAPGGKTLHLMDLLPGRDILAADISPRRLQTLSENFARCRVREPWHLLAADGTTLPFADNTFAGILLDAPCSATGTLARHPDIFHTRTPADIASLTHLQDVLLEEALRILKPGGTLIYATCSLIKEEGGARLRHLTAKNNLAEETPFTSEDTGTFLKKFLTSNGHIRTLPGAGWDGFFVGRLTKKR